MATKKKTTENKKFKIDDFDTPKKKVTSKKSYESYFIGLGGTGNNLLNVLSKESALIEKPENQCYYVNFSKTDLSSKFKGTQLLLNSANGEGTGKSLEKGNEIVKKNIKELTDFCEKIYKENFRTDLSEKRLFVISSLGGGTGSSLIPIFLDYFSEFENIKITLIPVVSSRSEGVTTLPNALRNFEGIYNDYVLTNKVTSCFMFDNERFESDDNSYDFNYINSAMVKAIDNIFDNSFADKSSEGYQALDLNEKKRVLYFGRGLSDFIQVDLKFGDKLELNSSSILNEKFDRKKTKAVSILIETRMKEEELKNDNKVELNSVIKSIKKAIPDAFFVFGYTFNNKILQKGIDYRVTMILNGLEFPKSMERDIKIASKAVEKIKGKNESFKNETDLSF
jgi:cell division GTPase FtsZ